MEILKNLFGVLVPTYRRDVCGAVHQDAKELSLEVDSGMEHDYMASTPKQIDTGVLQVVELDSMTGGAEGRGRRGEKKKVRPHLSNWDLLLSLLHKEFRQIALICRFKFQGGLVCLNFCKHVPFRHLVAHGLAEGDNVPGRHCGGQGRHADLCHLRHCGRTSESRLVGDSIPGPTKIPSPHRQGDTCHFKHTYEQQQQQQQNPSAAAAAPDTPTSSTRHTTTSKSNYKIRHTNDSQQWWKQQHKDSYNKRQ